MIPKKLFYYWEGKRYPYIDYCLKSIEKRSGVETHLITPQNVNDYISDIEINENWRKIKIISQKVDILRIAILFKYGGLWCDADTIILKDLNSLYDSLPESDLIGIKWELNNKILNGYFFTKQYSEFMRLCLDWINEKLKSGYEYYDKHQGTYFGEVMFKEISNKYPEYVKVIDPRIFLPIQFPFKKNIWYQCTPVDEHLRCNTAAIGLNHSQYPSELRNRPIEEILKLHSLFGNIFKYSESLGSIL